jgi:hypothetical protein
MSFPERLETGLRAVALAALGWLLWGALRPEPAPANRASLGAAQLADGLAEWARRPPAETLHVDLGGNLAPAWRASLRALRRAGTGVTWRDGGVAPVALEAEGLVDPAEGVAVRLAGPAGAVPTVEDDLGVIDTLRLSGPGATLRMPLAAGPVRVRLGRTAAAVPVTPAPGGGSAVILGAVGWEARFVIAALEERGWRVDARLDLAPGLAVTQGRPLPLDPQRHAVAIVLDSLGAAGTRRVAEFVTRGGGLVVVGPAALRGIAGASPGRVNRVVRPAVLGGPQEDPLGALVLDGLQPAEDAVVLAERAGVAAIAARRVGAGRVIYVGYRETWRWRLTGPAGADDAHREWWASIVAAAAPHPLGSPEPGLDQRLDAAPRAALAAALGPGTEAPPAPGRAGGVSWRVMLVLAAAALFGEWSSRRLRGLA